MCARPSTRPERSTSVTVPESVEPAGMTVSPLIVTAFVRRALTGASTCADADEIVDVIVSGSDVPAGIVTSLYSGSFGAGGAAGALGAGAVLLDAEGAAYVSFRDAVPSFRGAGAAG